MDRFRRTLLVVASLGLMAPLIATAATTTAAAGASSPVPWSLVATTDSSPSLTNVLYGDACMSGGNCVAVGSATTAAGHTQTLVESWNGTNFSTVSSPDTSSTLDNTLSAVSCASTTFCMAVGTATSQAGYVQTLAERWNGTTWTIVATPDTSATFPNSLSGVSCTSSTNCVAVGSAAVSTGSVTVVETWNGTSWTLVSSPNAPGTAYDSLAGVTCPSATFCSAVGYSVANGGTEQNLAETWNGSTWSVTPSPDTTTALPNALASVSCASASSCTAVGAAFASGGTAYRTEVQVWNGSSWVFVASPDVTTAANELQAVSCSGGTCTAAGYATTSGGIEQSLVETSSGGAWSVVATPEPGQFGNSLQGIACLGSACTAVGSDEPGAGLFQTVAMSNFSAPTLSVPATATFVFGGTNALSVTSTGSPAPTYSLSGAPAGLTIDPVSGVLSGSPLKKIGIFPVTVIASNGVGSAATGTVTITVPGLAVTTTTLPSATRGVPYSFQLAGTGGATTLIWKKSGKLPPGIKLNVSGLISGTTSVKRPAGVYSFNINLSEVTPSGKLKTVVPVTLTVN